MTFSQDIFAPVREGYPVEHIIAVGFVALVIVLTQVFIRLSERGK